MGADKQHYPLDCPYYWYRAGGTLEFQPRILSGSALSITGLVFDQLEWTSGMEWSGVKDSQGDAKPFDKSFIDTLWELVQMRLGNSEEVLLFGNQKQALRDAFFLSLVKGFPAISGGPQDNITLFRLRKRFTAAYHYLRRTAAGAGHGAATPMTHQALHYLQELEYCRGRHLAITHSSRSGLVPRLARPGDVCCVVPGNSVVYILRPGADCNIYRLVGSAYVHGVMAGELVWGAGPNDWKEIALI